MALRHGTSLILDQTFLGDQPNATRREYALGAYKVAAAVIDRSGAIAMGLPVGRIPLWLARRNVLPSRRRKYVMEKGYRYDPRVLEASAAEVVVYEGYWQSAKYFREFESQIREDLVSVESDGLRRLSAQVREVTSVSVHVRRGDYVHNAAAAATHGVCPPDYYENSFVHIERVVKDPRYFLFCDDRDWLERHSGAFNRPMTVVAGAGSLSAQEELILMSRCRHHILANSSFSWWGAWLDGREDSIVIAPRRWFSADIDTSDLVLERWESL